MPISHLFVLAKERWQQPWRDAFRLHLPQDITADAWPLYLADHATYEAIPTIDNGEPIIDLKTLANDRNITLIFSSGTAAYGNVDNAFFLRRGAAERLMDAAQNLQRTTNGRITFRITDTFRPIALQRTYFNAVRAQLMEEGLEGEALYRRIVTVIADPDDAPPHTTGGAVDLTLYDNTTGKDLPMGTLVDEIDNDRIYTWHPDLSQEEKENRSLLFSVLTDAGFVNFPGEWWHYSYGEREWAWRTGASTALYGVVED